MPSLDAFVLGFTAGALITSLGWLLLLWRARSRGILPRPQGAPWYGARPVPAVDADDQFIDAKG